MKRFALIGETLAHSYSVPIHETLFSLMGLKDTYFLKEIDRETFHTDVMELLTRIDGMNVTIPYKQRIIPLLSAMDPLAERVGAVNTVVKKDGAWIGCNTDVYGFMKMLRMHSIDPKGMPCFILGTGGASRAVYVALEEMQAACITYVSRTPGDHALSYDALPDVFDGLLVNCTPVGMYPHGDGCPLAPGALKAMLPRMQGCADLIYNPSDTRLTAFCRAHGVPACTGLGMLVAQAVQAERFWQDIPIPPDMTQQILKEWKP